MGVMERAAWIQAGATVILALITLAYVRLTSRLVHSAHMAHLRPVSVSTGKDPMGWVIRIKNFGPGTALDVKLRTVVVTKTSLDPLQPKPLRTWTESHFCVADGPFELAKDATAEYHFSGLINFKRPFFLSWRTVSGGRQSNAWIISIGARDKIRPCDRIRRILFWTGWILTNVISPYFSFVKWQRHIIAKRRGKINSATQKREADLTR